MHGSGLLGGRCFWFSGLTRVDATCGCDVHANPVYAFGYHAWIFPYIYFD